jgi:hypothetical protein
MHRLFSRYFPSKRRYYSRSSSGWEHLRMNHLQTERFSGDLPSDCSVETKPTNCQSSAAHCVCTSYFRASLSSARTRVRHCRTHETLAWKFAQAKTFRIARGHGASTEILTSTYDKYHFWQKSLMTKVTDDKKYSTASNLGNICTKLQKIGIFESTFGVKKDNLTFQWRFDFQKHKSKFLKERKIIFLNKEINLRRENLLTIDFQVPRMKQMCV